MPMAVIMMVNCKMVWDMAKGYSPTLIKMYTMANGRTTRGMGKEKWSFLLVISIKVNGRKTSDMDKDDLRSRMVNGVFMNLLVYGVTIKRSKGYLQGQVPDMKVSLKTTNSMEEEYKRAQLLDMTEISWTTISMAKEYAHTHQMAEDTMESGKMAITMAKEY